MLPSIALQMGGLQLLKRVKQINKKKNYCVGSLTFIGKFHLPLAYLVSCCVCVYVCLISCWHQSQFNHLILVSRKPYLSLSFASPAPATPPQKEFRLVVKILDIQMAHVFHFLFFCFPLRITEFGHCFGWLQVGNSCFYTDSSWGFISTMSFIGLFRILQWL